MILARKHGKRWCGEIKGAAQQRRQPWARRGDCAARAAYGPQRGVAASDWDTAESGGGVVAARPCSGMMLRAPTT